MEQDWELTCKKIRAAKESLRAIKIGTSASNLGESLGKLPSGAALFRADQTELDTLLAAIRSDTPDKAVLLDIWATWCGPCLDDMQNSAENLQKLKSLGVEVVYLCVASGSDEATWQKKVAEMNLPTRHLFLNPELSKGIMSYFRLNGYPSHVFLS